MKSSNVILQAAIASAMLVMVGAAQATTTSTLAAAPVFARELLQGTTPNATVLTIPAANAIVVTSNAAIAANSTVYVYVRLNGASFANLPSVIPSQVGGVTVRDADGTGAALAGATYTLTAPSLGTTTGTVAPGAPGAGVDYIVFQINTGATPIGVGSEVARVGVAVPVQMNNAAALLTTPITVTASVGIGAPGAARFGALAASASSHDATSTAVNVATQAQGITITATANTNAGRIDLTATPVSTAFTGAVLTTRAQFGSFTATNSATAQTASGATPYTMAGQAGATGLNLTVTAPAGFFAALGTTGKMSLDVSNTCAAAGAGTNGMTSAVFTTAAAAAAATSITIPSTALPTSATPYYLCMELPAITATSVAMIPGTPTLAATITHTNTAIDSNNSVAATNMFALNFNGSTATVRSYLPLATPGYTSFVRVINTGSVNAAVTGQWVHQDGTTSIPAATLITSLVAGGATTLSSAQIEAALGAPTASIGINRPRLRLTAPTNGMSVQSYVLTNANGNFSEVSGAE